MLNRIKEVQLKVLVKSSSAKPVGQRTALMWDDDYNRFDRIYAKRKPAENVGTCIEFHPGWLLDSGNVDGSGIEAAGIACDWRFYLPLGIAERELAAFYSSK